MLVFSNGRIRVERGGWSASGELVLDAPAGTPVPGAAASPGQPEPQSPPSRPCLALLVSRELLVSTGAAQQIAADLERLKQLRAERVPSLLGTGSHGGECFTAVDSSLPLNLGERLKEWRFVGWEEAVRLLTELARALDEAHRGGLLAGTLEPYQIQLEPAGKVNLAVFGAGLGLMVRGAALEGGAGELPLAPELRRSGTIEGQSESSDLHQLGVLGIRLLTGQVPTQDALSRSLSPEAAQRLLFELAHRDFDIPLAVPEVLAALVDPDPARRPKSAMGVLERLDRLSHRQLSHARRLVLGDDAADDAELERAPGPSATGLPPPGPELSAGGSFGAGSTARPAPPGRRPVSTGRILANLAIVMVILWCLFTAFNLVLSRESPLRRMIEQGAPGGGRPGAQTGR